jgi:hypothetical protein
MNVNMQSTKHAKWTTRIWRTLAASDDAISVSPMEHLEKRIAALEQKIWAESEPQRTHRGRDIHPTPAISNLRFCPRTGGKGSTTWVVGAMSRKRR